MDGDKDPSMSTWYRWLDYYRTPGAFSKYRKVPNKIFEKKLMRKHRRRTYDINKDIKESVE